jgi:hypothetical protein
MSLSKLKNGMQLLGAAFFVLTCMGLIIAAISNYFPEGRPAWFITPLALVGFFVSFFLAMIIFRGKGPSRVSAERYAARIRKLEEDGLLISQSFRARRAFKVDEFEDEGPSYFIELEDSSVLFLNGQYLWDYEPRATAFSTPRSRAFPSTEFSVRRHKESGYAVDILCQGDVIEPEAVAPWFDEEDYNNHLIPPDGTILRDQTYEQIKKQRLNQK